MFEFEIMLTGYTLAVATVSVGLTKFFSRKKFLKIYDKLSAIQSSLQNVESEIKKLKMDASNT